MKYGKNNRLKIAVLILSVVGIQACTNINIRTPESPQDATPIFHGKDLDGWHVSRTSHQGTS